LTYLDYINHFHQKDEEYFFSNDEYALFFRLLRRANVLRKSCFNLAVERLMMDLQMRTKRPFDTARKRLRDAGLLDFQNGNGRGCTTEYQLLGLEFNTERGIKNTPLPAPLSDTLSATKTQQKRNENDLLHKTKIKTKKKESNDSLRADKISDSSSLVEPPQPEPWAAWLAENAPTVQHLKTPLTGKQWTKLVADFTEPVVKEVLLAMENKAGLLKTYTSANLTARDWCGRRQPQRPAPLTPVQSTRAPETLKADLNPKVIAERQARQEAELAANRRRQRESQATATSS